MSDHDGFKSSRLDSYTDGIVVSVWLKTAPRSEHLLASSRYRKFCALGVSQLAATVPYTAQRVGAALALVQSSL